MLQSLIRNFGFTEVTPSRNRKERRCFLLLFARFFVTLASSKLLSLGKAQTSLAFRSFIRNFAPNFNKNKKPQ